MKQEGATDWRIDELRANGDRVAVAYSWRTPNGARTLWAQLLKLRGDKIVDIQDFANPAKALRRVPRSAI
ncbi:MAG TPA: hypothetical protein VFR43_02145 [Gaiellaceae bacterium]|nr:hypothetical protein [Gaiellaceae bacterium]